MEISLKDLATFNATKAPILFCDLNEVCRYGNSAFFDWYGKKKEEIIGKIDLKTLLGDSNYHAHYSYIANALKGEKQSIELSLTILEGESRETLLTLLPYTVDNLVLGFFLHLTDFTELRQVAKREPLFEKPTAGLFASFIENSPVPAWIVDPEGIVRYLNEAYLKVKPQVRIGQSILKSFPTEIAEAYQTANREILALRKTFFGTEKVIDGLLGERVFKIVKFPLFYENKYMIGGFAIDITEQVQAHLN
jgi:PAS domain S-box-containing protein